MKKYKFNPFAKDEDQHGYDFLLNDMLRCTYSKAETEAFFKEPIKRWNGWEWSWYDVLEKFYIEVLVWRDGKDILEKKEMYSSDIMHLKNTLKYLYQGTETVYTKIYKLAEEIPVNYKDQCVNCNTVLQ